MLPPGFASFLVSPARNYSSSRMLIEGRPRETTSGSGNQTLPRRPERITSVPSLPSYTNTWDVSPIMSGFRSCSSHCLASSAAYAAVEQRSGMIGITNDVVHFMRKPRGHAEIQVLLEFHKKQLRFEVDEEGEDRFIASPWCKRLEPMRKSRSWLGAEFTTRIRTAREWESWGLRRKTSPGVLQMTSGSLGSSGMTVSSHSHRQLLSFC